MSYCVALFIPHAPGRGSVKALRNRVNVRDGRLIVRECSNVNCEGTCEGMFARKRSRRATRDTTFARECSRTQGHRKGHRATVKDAILYASIYAATLVNVAECLCH